MKVAELVLEYLRVFVWPGVVLAICIIFRKSLIALVEKIRHAELPGGVIVDMASEVREVKVLSAKVPEPEKRATIPLTEANARMITLGLRPSPSGLDISYYRSLADQDPALALAGLRMELEVLTRNLARGFKVEVADRDSGMRMLRRLFDAGAVTSEQRDLAAKVLQVCNAALHGTQVSREEALDVLESAQVLADQYLSWLNWGFEDGWKPKGEDGPRKGAHQVSAQDPSKP